MNTLPGIAARAVLEVMTAAMVVFSRLALKGSAPPAYSPCEQDFDYPAVP